MQDLPPPPSAYYSFCKKQLPLSLASIIKVPPDPSQKEIAYKDLVCTEQDKANIYEIITAMSKHGKLGLLMKSGHLKELGAQIDHVHPLKFLATIFGHPELKTCMWDVFDDYFKKSHFMDGVSTSLSREMEKGALIKYLEPFSTELGHHPHNTPHIRGYFNAHEWEELVNFLMQN